MSTFLIESGAQIVLPLYPGKIPNSKPAPDEETSEYDADGLLIISKISRPTLTVCLPPKEKATGVAVIICPGGGYWVVAAGHEGADVAKSFNDAGIAAFVLKYRIPNDHTMVNKEIGPLQDAQRALQIVRSRAAEWGIDPHHVGIMGFSAGGHLASTAGTHFKKSYIDNPRKINLRPDFMLLIYPVISFTDAIGHIGSRDQLLGKNPSQEKIKYYSNELQVTDQTPPAFLVHAKDDPAVPYANSEAFASALKKHHIPVKVFLYEKGGHGFGLINKTSDIRWMDICLEWLKSTGN
ncbi:MAG: alpha/beta hydrolase [Bacteroidota bacterium]|nr:alpha/beta hydrolase [Bacteroidota bacterium]